METYILYFIYFVTHSVLSFIIYRMFIINIQYKSWKKGYDDSNNISDKYISELKCLHKEHISETEKDGYENLIKLEEFYDKEIKKINNRLNKNDLPPLLEYKDKKNIN